MRRIKIIAKPKSRKEKVEKIDEGTFKVFVKERPERGKANEAIIRVLSEYFNSPKSKLKIVSGFKSREKIIEIE